MKKIIVVILLILINMCFIAPFATAYALDFPYIVVDGEVWLLDSTTGGRIFLLPDTYYAKIDNLDENYYYITFNGVSGKVEKTLVSTIGYHTTAVGTIQDINVGEKYRIFTEIKLKSSMDSSGTDIEVPTSESLIFLGKYPSTDMWYYVKYNEICGYIRAEFTTQPDLVISPFVPEEEEIVIVEEDTETLVDDTVIDNPFNTDLVRILVISGLCFVLVILIILIFRPSKGKSNRYYYED
jgi:hypothetical protein